MLPNKAKQFIKEVFTNVIENIHSNEVTYQEYFSTEYVQYVDGKKMEYPEFISHMNALKTTIKSVKVTFKHIVAENDKIATIHVVNAQKQDGNEIEVQVNAIFQIKNGKIILCDELTHLIKGEKSDKDLGSRTQ